MLSFCCATAAVLLWWLAEEKRGPAGSVRPRLVEVWAATGCCACCCTWRKKAGKGAVGLCQGRGGGCWPVGAADAAAGCCCCSQGERGGGHLWRRLG